MRKYSVAIHGTGFIGLVSGCCFSIRGFSAINSTFNEKNCEQINQGVSPFYENGLAELLKEAIDSGNFKCVIGREKACSSEGLATKSSSMDESLACEAIAACSSHPACRFAITVASTVGGTST